MKCRDERGHGRTWTEFLVFLQTRTLQLRTTDGHEQCVDWSKEEEEKQTGGVFVNLSRIEISSTY